ncbi:alpha-glucosidase [Acetitomaculum ruminis DSM 5522]|uniref:Alpha-glucosidase n=1 Tax=Acetitomaculum ruminis DSM 5522 TaxID=1120918 RepID=A0A1I0W2Q0_9FIRM|nr:glycoside hydrolase family 13 protein [Acetitomaculum ruminis]SFA82530.1 alpha-glucosidase [Acetitomaculum ruminis DSM 5522]
MEKINAMKTKFENISTKDEIFKPALFSDETINFRKPLEVKAFDQVEFIFRTLKNNVTEVFLCCENKKHPMKLFKNDDYFDYYQCFMEVGKESLDYYFLIENSFEACFYNKEGAVKERNPDYDFTVIPDFYVPKWARGALMYQIFVDRFYDGCANNNVHTGEYEYLNHKVIKYDDWGKSPKTPWEFFGGDLQGVIEKLDYLKELGVEAIYFNPIFVSPSNHKYDTADYNHIDPHIAVVNNNSKNKSYSDIVTDEKNLKDSDALFEKLVKTAHEKGIRVILDGVFNHCGSFNCWLDKEGIYYKKKGFEEGAYFSKDSPYVDYFDFSSENWPCNEDYEGWWGHKTLPKLNYEKSKKLFKSIMEVGKKWLKKPYNIDGWRLDVAADLGHSEEFNHHFWNSFRKEVKSVNNEALILAEHYGDAKKWLNGKEWDSVMNYDAFMEPVSWFFTGMEKHSDRDAMELLGNAGFFVDAMKAGMKSFSIMSLMTAMNELSNHDHSRFLTRTNKIVGRVENLGPKKAEENLDKAIFMEAVVLQATWIGCPTIYYGDEAGVCGFTDPDDRRTYPWGKEDKLLLAFHKRLFKIRKEHKNVIAQGSTIFLNIRENVLSYGRFDNEEKIVVLFNVSEEAKTIELPLWKMGVKKARAKQLFFTTEEGFDDSLVVYDVENGMARIDLCGKVSKILKIEDL